jgi:hypothetical protein
MRPLVAKSRAVQIACWAEEGEIARRVAQRAATAGRHPGHYDAEALPDVLARLRAGAYAPLNLAVPLLTVDTTAGYEPSFDRIRTFALFGQTAAQ